MKVLIADDDVLTRKLLLSYLQKWGYEVTAACDGAEAWRLFEAGDFPIVISDWVMPEMTGVEFIRRIRSSPKAECAYVILLTSRARKEDLVEGMEAGADDFVTKPFDRDELRVRLREGERIIRLEQSVVENNRLLAEARQALAHREPLADGQQQTAQAAERIARLIGTVTDQLAQMRREMLAELGQVRPTGSTGAPVSQHDLSAFQDRLTRLIDQAGESLQEASELLAGWSK